MRPRRAGGDETEIKVARVAEALRQKGALSDVAPDYLVGWAEGTRPRAPRPTTYSFQSHSPQAQARRGVLLQDRRPPEAQLAQVAVLNVAGVPLPADDAP